MKGVMSKVIIAIQTDINDIAKGINIKNYSINIKSKNIS